MALPPLETTRLSLAPAGRADVDVLWALWREPGVRRYLFDDVAVGRERAVEIVEAAVARHGDGLGIWLVRRRGSAAIIGVAGLLPVAATAVHDPDLAGTPELLVALEASARGHGYASEILGALLRYAFVERGTPRVLAVIDVPNEASHRIVWRAGLRPLGERDGPRYRAVTYAIDASRHVDVRPAAAPDAVGIERVARAAWRATYREIIPEDVQERALAAWYAPALLSRVMGSPQAIFLVAAERADVVGFAQFMQRTATTAELTRIYLLPERQGQGIGTRLLETGLAECRERGVKEITVFVERDNRNGRAFYRARKFEEIAEHTREVHGHPVTLVECRRPVTR
jgi:RimJ/RimL family protein N-acetyltransferase